MFTPHDYAQLPGPTHAVTQIAAELRAGKSVVIVFPDHLIDNYTADAVLEEIYTAGSTPVYCSADADEPFPARILATYAANPVTHRDYDTWETIITWEPWHGAWVFVPGWEHPDIATILDRWPPQVHASSLPIGDRPKLILGVSMSDTHRGVLDRLDKDTVTVHWWWGVLDRLDTETRLAAVAGRTLNAVDAAVITEVSGWDMQCVDYLTEHWDRTTAGLPHAVRDYQNVSPAADTDDPGTMVRATTIPPVDHETAWRAGLIDRWGHSVRRSPRILDDKAITQRLWMAHNRTLIPMVDEERAHYEQLVRDAARPGALNDLDRRDDDLIEIGSLVWLTVSGRVTIDRTHVDRLCTLRDVRNALAHRIPLDDTLLTQIVSYLDL